MWALSKSYPLKRAFVTGAGSDLGEALWLGRLFPALTMGIIRAGAAKMRKAEASAALQGEA